MVADLTMAYRRSPSPSSDDSNDCNDAGNRGGVANVFRNDGSFLEMFKKMQNASQQKGTASSNPSDKTNAASAAVKTESRAEDSTTSKSAQPPPVPLVGRRRGMKVLPVGKVKKLKTDEDSSQSTKKDAWAKYLDEVKKYKETYCDGESKVRSLVKWRVIYKNVICSIIFKFFFYFHYFSFFFFKFGFLVDAKYSVIILLIEKCLSVCGKSVFECYGREKYWSENIFVDVVNKFYFLGP